VAANHHARTTTTRTTQPGSARDPRTLRLHPQADLIPEMLPDEYAPFLADVADNGIDSPLDITPAGIVLDGRHRLRAALEADLARVPVRVVSPTDEVDYLVRCAVLRRHLTPSQRAAIIVAHTSHTQAALEVATLPAPGRRRDTAARLAGVSPRLIQDAATVHRHDPALFNQIRDGLIPAHRAARQIRRHTRDATLTTPPLPRGHYQVILADPPWQSGNPDSAFAPEQHYPTLPLKHITAIQPPAAKDAILFLWAVSSLLPEALDVASAWGFTYKTNLVWDKGSIGPGVWLRNRHELLLVCVRGA
jgi:hypothetical protein